MTCPRKLSTLFRAISPPVSEEADFSSPPQKKKVKRYFKWKYNYLVQYKWLMKYQSCTKFPNISSKKFEFVKGWSGNEDGFKEEMFKRHDENSKHVACMKEYEKLNAAISNHIFREVKSWANKFPASTNNEL